MENTFLEISRSTSPWCWSLISAKTSAPSESGKMAIDNVCDTQPPHHHIHHCTEASTASSMSLDEDNRQPNKQLKSAVELCSGNTQKENIQQDFDRRFDPKQKACTNSRNSALGAHATIKDSTEINIDDGDVSVSIMADVDFMNKEAVDFDHGIFYCTCLELWAKKITKCLTDQFIRAVIHARENMVIDEDGRQSMDAYLLHLDVLQTRVTPVRSAIVKELKGSERHFLRLLPDKACDTKHKVPQHIAAKIVDAVKQAIKEFRAWADEQREPENDPSNTNQEGNSNLASRPTVTSDTKQNILRPTPRIVRSAPHRIPVHHPASLPGSHNQGKPIREPATPPLNLPPRRTSITRPQSPRRSLCDLMMEIREACERIMQVDHHITSETLAFCPLWDRLFDESQNVLHSLGVYYPSYRRRKLLQGNDEAQQIADQRQDRNASIPHHKGLAQTIPDGRPTQQSGQTQTGATATGTPRTQHLIQQIQKTCNTTIRETCIPQRIPVCPGSEVQTPSPEAKSWLMGHRTYVSSPATEGPTSGAEREWGMLMRRVLGGR